VSLPSVRTLRIAGSQTDLDNHRKTFNSFRPSGSLRFTTTTSTGTSTEDIVFSVEKKDSCNSAIHWNNIQPIKFFQRRFSAYN